MDYYRRILDNQEEINTTEKTNLEYIPKGGKLMAPPRTSPIRMFVITENIGVDRTGSIRQLFADAGLPLTQCRVDTVVRIQGEFDFDKLQPILANPQAGQTVTEITGQPQEKQGVGVVEIAYRPSVVDPETDAGLQAAHHLGATGVEWIRLSTRYELAGIDQATAECVLTSERTIFNPVVQVVVEGDTYATSLKPSGEPQPTETYDFRGKETSALVDLSGRMRWSLSETKLKTLQLYQATRLERPYTRSEIEIIAQCWCDHCYHITVKGLGLWDALLEAHRTHGDPNYALVIEGNAGAILFYDGYALSFKHESHNHPDGIFPRGAVETKHGGVLRDGYCNQRGGDVIAASTIQGTRRPSAPQAKGALSARTIIRGEIDGTRDYCNPMGIPNSGAWYRSHSGYVKPWTLGGITGIQPVDSLKTVPLEVGVKLYLCGGPTGRDGIHGATGSSLELTATNVELEGAEVQVGAPAVERTLATFAPASWHLVNVRTDLGAGGISCAVTELTKDSGAEIDVTGIPVKDTGLASHEKLVSESQERWLDSVTAENEAEYLELAALHNVQVFCLGTVRDDRRLIIHDRGEIVVDLDLEFIWGECPIEMLTVEDPNIKREPITPSHQPQTADWLDLLIQLVGSYDLADQSPAAVQYDKTVGGRTVVSSLLDNGVPSDVSVHAPIFGKPYGAIATSAFVPLWNSVDPVGAVRCLMALAFSRAIATGAILEHCGLSDNFYVPTRTPEQRWYLEQMWMEMIRLGLIWRKLPGSGKDSCYGTFVDADGNIIDVPSTFVASVIAKIPDVGMVRTKTFDQPNDELFLIRPECNPNIAGSSYLATITGREEAEAISALLPWPVEEQIALVWNAIHVEYAALTSVAAIGEAGAFLQLFHGSLASGLGASLELPAPHDELVWDLFGECPGSYVVSVPEGFNIEGSALASYAKRIGTITAHQGLVIRSGASTLLKSRDWQTLVASWEHGFVKEVYPQ